MEAHSGLAPAYQSILFCFSQVREVREKREGMRYSYASPVVDKEFFTRSNNNNNNNNNNNFF